MGLLLSFFFFFFLFQAFKTVAACMRLRRVRDLGAKRGQIGKAVPQGRRTRANSIAKAHCEFHACLDFYHAG